jgi:5-hydroxyisourate hydrolase-like protein (transthyretin family)
MKKSILLFAVALGMLTACDPIKEDGSMKIDSFTSSTLLDGAEFSQYADQACSTPQADGNWIKYNVPKATSVYIYYVKADGSEFKLSSGSAGGVFNFVPARGSDPNQTVYFRFVNANGDEVIASKEFTVQVAAELKPEVRLIASNAYGKKTWKWNVGNNTSSGHVWGNFGADGSWRGDALNDFVWWGVDDAADLTGQLGHSVTGQATGEESNDATMVFTEDGLVKCYDANGSEIRNGTYEIKGWTGDNHDGFKYGVLHTSEGATLFPFEINAGGRYVTDYWIYSLTSDQMILVYPDNGAFSGWSEGTYWNFKSDSDVSGMMTNYGSKTWTWNVGNTTSSGHVWGNFGADGNWRGEYLNDFVWWGVDDAADLTGQLGHSVTGSATGEENNDATMVLNEDGTVKCYDASGSEIRSGSYEIDLSTADGWKKGTFKTTEGAILFPFEINAGGRYVTDFQIFHISGSEMILTYPDNGAFSGWSEGTYWNFKAK